MFKDNGYQLGNDRDAPIYHNPSYFPMTVRITPQWHLERLGRQAVDSVPGNAESGMVESTVKMSGFDLSGFDLIMGGTLAKNISFMVLPSFESDGTGGFEAVWVRFDDILGSRWLNLKLGKFELDLPVSEHRSLTMSSLGGYNIYHFTPGSPPAAAKCGRAW